jgi:Tfp pilus assembly protein PilZ
VIRVDLKLAEKSEWVKVFDPRDSTLFLASNDPPEVGAEVRVDLTVGTGGPKVILRGQVIARRLQGDSSLPKGASVALSNEEREKINYLNGFVRGGLLDLREKRRVPIRIPVTYGGVSGPVKTFTRDINEEGTFLLSEEPLPEESELHILIEFTDKGSAFSVTGLVAHTVVVEDEDVPGMGVRFLFKDGQQAELTRVVDDLEQKFLTGKLPERYLL